MRTWRVLDGSVAFERRVKKRSGLNEDGCVLGDSVVR